MAQRARGSRSRIMRTVEDAGRGAWGRHPEHASADAMRALHRGLSLIFGPGRPFPLRVEGWSRLPEPPALYVSNHSGGSIMLDAWGFWYAWHEHFQFQRMSHGLGHEMLFTVDSVGRLLASIGSVQASKDNALDVLTQWRRDLCVMPGGDQDTWRTWSQRYRVCFAGRTGYARLAIKAGVPIVPVAHAGAHDTLIVLSRGNRLARVLGVHQLARAEIFPVHVSFPWGLTIGPWPHLPPPQTLHYTFGHPIEPPSCEPDTDPSPEMVEALDAEVRRAMQSLLDAYETASLTGRLKRRLGLS